MKCKFCNQEHSIEELCKISRRSFFFFSTAALVTLATANLSLPSPRKILTESEIVAVELERFLPKVKNLFEKYDLFWAHMHPAQKRFYEDMLPNGPGRKFIT